MTDNSPASASDDLSTIRHTDDLLVGTVFADRYEILSQLGSGGMCVVYKARHKFMNRIVAVKMLHARLLEDASSLRRFQQEAEAISCLSHSNLVTAFDFGVSPEGQPFMVMDFLDGGNLTDFLDKHDHMPVAECVSIFIQIADAIAHAHHKGITHRDLKPSNVMLSKANDGTKLPKVVDFGIATFLPESGLTREKLTRTGQAFGSAEYMSPEQCKGKKGDYRADVYSFGCLMYEMLTGLPPFTGDNPFEIFQKHILDQAEPFFIVRPDLKIPAKLETIVMTALEKDVDARYQTMEAVKRDLLDLEEDLRANPLLSGGASSPEAPLAEARAALAEPGDEFRQRVVAVEIAAIVVAIIAMALILNWDAITASSGSARDSALWSRYDREGQHAFDAGKYAEAETQFRLAVEQAERFGTKDNRLVVSLRKLGDVYCAQGRFTDAKALDKRIEQLDGSSRRASPSP